MRNVVVIGVGMTKFGKFPETPIEVLGRQAAWDAMKDAGMGPKDIQVAYVGNLTERRETGHISCVGQEILRGVGIRSIPITRVENACASGSTAFREAYMAVASGFYDIAMALGVEKLTGGTGAPLGPHRRQHRRDRGVRPSRGVGDARAKAHGPVRHDPRAARDGGREEPQKREAEPPGVPRPRKSPSKR